MGLLGLVDVFEELVQRVQVLLLELGERGQQLALVILVPLSSECPSIRRH